MSRFVIRGTRDAPPSSSMVSLEDARGWAPWWRRRSSSWAPTTPARSRSDTGKQAVLIRRVGLDLAARPGAGPAPQGRPAYYKGVQTEGAYGGVLTEGRYFYNPFYWALGDHRPVRRPQRQDRHPDRPRRRRPARRARSSPSRARRASSAKVELPGRYPYNPYAEKFELHDPVTVPAGFRGVVTLLAGRKPKDPNVFLVGDGERGVQNEDARARARYYLNPYETRVSLVDCRSKRFNLGEGSAMDFLSSDGFPVTLDGAVEFRVIPERAAEVFVKYNEDDNGDAIDEEIIAKIITPESRSLCRTGGSKLSGGQFISGDDREVFQRNLVKSLTENCKKQGVEILAVAITRVEPPQDIADAGPRPRGRQAEARPVQPGEDPAALRGQAPDRGPPGRAEAEGRRGRRQA